MHDWTRPQAALRTLTGPAPVTRRWAVLLVAALAGTLAACAALPVGPDARPLLLLGEQQDAAWHQVLHARTVTELAAQQRLAALALEMAEQGASTAGLPASASEAEVRQALRWDERAWPWAPYAPAVMAAVRAGVPVLGANLSRDQMRTAMADAGLASLLPPEAWAQQQEAVRQGHCGLMPEAQLGSMARIQVARDRAMAQTLVTLAKGAAPGQRVLLLAGAAHVDPALGVPRHLPAGLVAQARAWPAQAPQKDYCEELRRQMAPQDRPQP